MDRYRFELPNGRVIVGAVQGNGGVLRQGTNGLARLLLAKQRVQQGREIALYEPEPGCVLVFPDYSAEGNGREELVPLKDAKISLELCE